MFRLLSGCIWNIRQRRWNDIFWTCLTANGSGSDWAAFPDDLTASGHDGIYDRCSAARSAEDTSLSMLESISPAVGAASPPEEADEKPFLHVCSLSPVLTGSVSDPGGPLWLEKSRYAQIISLLAVCSLDGTSSPSSGAVHSYPRQTVVAVWLPVERSNLITRGMSPSVVATIQSARVSTTRGLCQAVVSELKWTPVLIRYCRCFSIKRFIHPLSIITCPIQGIGHLQAIHLTCMFLDCGRNFPHRNRQNM